MKDREETQRFSHDAMATTFELCLVTADRSYAQQAAHEVFAEFDRLERELSRFVEHSDIARINGAEEGERTIVGIETFECLQLAQKMTHATDGAFDVGIGALVPNRPKFERASDTSCAGGVGFELHAADRSVVKLHSAVLLDLGGIGKGYALDEAARILDLWGLTSGWIHAGQSSMLVLAGTGYPPTCVSIRDPNCHERVIGEAILPTGAMSGSGRLLHGDHVIDPRAGGPCAPGIAGAWAIAPTAAVSDALSTAFMVMGLDGVMDCCCRHPDYTGIIATLDGGRLKAHVFGGASVTLA